MKAPPLHRILTSIQLCPDMLKTEICAAFNANPAVLKLWH